MTMNREEAILHIEKIKEFLTSPKICWSKYDNKIVALDMAIEALKKMEKAIEINICEGTFDYESGTVTYYSIPKETDIESKQKGEWILECDGENECDNLYKCSMCGFECGCEEYDKPNFCPNCGYQMIGGDRG